MNAKRQLLFLNLYNVLFSLRIADGVWVVFLLARGFSLMEVGLAQSVYSLTSFFGEVPSGVAADLLGRKRTLAAAGVCGVLASLLMAFSQNLMGICAAMAVQAIMFNLRSGTQQALAYDTLKAADREKEYPRANAVLRVVSRVSASLSSLLGGFATLLGYFPAYLLNALSGVACGACTLAIQEPQVTEAQRRRTQHPFAGMGSRLKDHLINSIRFFRERPAAGLKLLASAAAAVPVYLSAAFLQQSLLDGGLPNAFLGMALMLLNLSSTVGMVLGARLKTKLFPLALACGLGCGAATLLAGASWWLLALLGGFGAQILYNVLDLRVDVSLNQVFPSDQRATLVSVRSMAYSLLMIAASPLAGAVGDAFGAAWTFRFLGLGLLLLTGAGGLLYRLWTEKNTHKTSS